MRAVFDTNVIVSGLLTGTGTCGRLLDLVLEGEVVLCADQRLLAEYREVASRPALRIDPTDAGRVIASSIWSPNPSQLGLSTLRCPIPTTCPFSKSPRGRLRP